MCYKAVNTYAFTIKSVSECFMSHEMCDKAVNRCVFLFHSIADQYKTQEMSNSNICKNQ